MISLFESTEQLPEDSIFFLNDAFAADKRPFKVNLGVGSYKTSQGLPYLFPSVQKAESLILKNSTDKEYLPIGGSPQFLKSTLPLIFGSELEKIDINCFYGAQTIGGTGALSLSADFLYQQNYKHMIYPTPTWNNHFNIFKKSGLNLTGYPYYDEKTHQINFEGMIQHLKQASKGTIVLLHASCHNPTGIDPTFEQWKTIAEIVKQKQLIPLFDLAYLGFGSGFEQDSYSVRLFAKLQIEMFIAVSFSKNFGLYHDRVGALFFFSPMTHLVKKVGSNIKFNIRCTYSNPPAHGAKIVSVILNDPLLCSEWKSELEGVRNRIHEMRLRLLDNLQNKVNGIDFNFLKNQRGMFSFCGLSSQQVEWLKSEKGIYMLSNSRINVAGLNDNNLDYVVSSILTSFKSAK